MLALVYLAICVILGYEIVSYLVPDTRRLFVAIAPGKKVLSKVPDILFKLPAGAIVGISVTTFVTYYVSLALSHVVSYKRATNFLHIPQSPLSFGLALSSVLYLYLIFTFIGKNMKRKTEANSKIPNFDTSIRNNLFYGISIIFFTCISSFLFFYSFRISSNILEAGYTTFSDLGPHTAMTSSFGMGSNFPTQYMHFSGDGIQYHFFFYFFCGILEFLGLPIDYAINVPSIIGMVCCFCLVGLLGVLMSGRRLPFIIAPVLILFRSSFNVYASIKRMTDAGFTLNKSLDMLWHSFKWFEDTPYDNWGIWAVNVYANQRHLMFGVSLILILVILFIPYVRRVFISMQKDNPFKAFMLCKNAWLPRKNDPISPVKSLILACILVIVMPYIHGSALIAGLLILFGMAIISENRLSYLIMAVCAVVSSFIQTRLFSGSYKEFVFFTHETGFVSTDKSFSGVTKYIIFITGLTMILAAVFFIVALVKDIVKKKPVYRSCLLITFLFPMIFAFNIKVSFEMLANHKFIQISLILMNIFVAIVLSNLFIIPFRCARKSDFLPELLPLDNDELEAKMASEESSKKSGIVLPLGIYIPMEVLSVLVALFLIPGLTGTGIVEWRTYINLNRNHLNINTESEVTKWITENTSPNDVFLTPMWSINRFYLAGRPSYFGWPYYAMSAGHDTYTRDDVYQWLVTGCDGDIDKFVSYCKEREIRYLLFDAEFYDLTDKRGNHVYNAEFFATNLKQVAYFPEDNNTIIYQIY